ncbi:antirestriction protein [Aquimarina sp. ERC-38]|uniref:antirestriction protein n=1 Tax=Aquimarina sp. ERC-38 TaxID=2949996 RepID=UPI00224506D4|nr:antirestriction protein [Aquimarina sp. ERC-38]UZO81391.1 antirestriction protein [Aquimarina sp. ERC-38]
MEKQHISFDNYQNTISNKDVIRLPDILQKGHQFFLEAQEFYYLEPEIRETVDIYLEQLNTHLFSNKKTPKKDALSSASFIKAFLVMHRTIQSREKLKEFILSLQKAVTNKEITKEDPYANHIEEIQDKLVRQYNEMVVVDQIEVIINPKWRSQLQKIVSPLPKKGLGNLDIPVPNARVMTAPTIKNDPLFTSFDQQPIKRGKSTFQLPGAMRVLLGDLEKFELAITIEGDQGGGKTRFTYQLADAFAAIGNRVAIFTLEIGGQSDLINRMREEYLSPQNRNRISKADRLPDGYNTITNAARAFDVIIIDSWNKTGLPSQDFDRLRKEHPDTIFIVIFQRTTQKTIRGGTAPLFDAGINIEVVKVDDTFQNNYAVTTKNRYGVTGIKYNIHTRNIIGAAEVPSESENNQIEML